MSFEISGKARQIRANPRWDLHDSKSLILKARIIFFKYLTTQTKDYEPKGVVLNHSTGQGRVVFQNTSLLPQEEFLDIESLRLKPIKIKKERK